MSWLNNMLSAALYAVFFQNFVFGGGYAASEAIRIGAKPRNLIVFSLQISFFTTSTALISRLLDLIPEIDALGIIEHTAIFALVLFFVYVIAYAVLAAFRVSEPALKRLGLAAFNTLVLAIPLIVRSAAYTVYESIGVGVGAGFAFIFASILIKTGVELTQKNEDMPISFRGTPAIFIYVALLSLAFTGFTGRSIFI